MWFDPCLFANYLFNGEEQYISFLYSGEKYSYSGKYSYLAWGKQEEIIDDIDQLEKNISINKKFAENIWFGYFSYEFGLDYFDYQFTKRKSKADFAKKLYFFKAKNLLIFNHQKKTIDYYKNGEKKNFVLPDNLPEIKIEIPKKIKISSNISEQEYFDKVQDIQEEIKAGKFYQVNLTRKFFAENLEIKNPFAIFYNLHKHSPSPYSACFKLKKNYIISSSPERFVALDKKGKINARPIKGTINKEAGEDFLRNSKKDQAENLMIVDLMRNDLSIASEKVQIDKLFEIELFSNVYHLSSSINAKLKQGKNIIDLMKQIMPPASMTGAPKFEVLKKISQLENSRRGIYSGVVGYLAGDGSCDFSVVIRTILIENCKRLEFQIGGGIIYDSDAKKEAEEILFKAKGIIEALNMLDEQVHSKE